MWFSNIASWSQKKLKLNFLFYGLIYLAFVLVAPIIIVSMKYNLVKSSSTRLTGVGLILVVCVAVFLFKGVKRLLNKLPQDELNEQRFKFTTLMIYSLMLPIGGILLLNLIKTNVDLACDTLVKVLASIIFSIMVDYMALHYLEAEWDLRQEAKHKNAVNKRAETLNKK